MKPKKNSHKINAKDRNKKYDTSQYSMYFMPADTAEVLRKANGFDLGNKFKNINLLFFKLLNLSNKKESTKILTQEINKELSKLQENNFLDILHIRLESYIKNYADVTKKKYQFFNLTCPWRLVVGLGNHNALEVGLTIHFLYGIPIIPGSALKGVARAWSIIKFADKYCNEMPSKKERNIYKILKEFSIKLDNGEDLGLEIDGLKFSDLIQIFGTKKNSGKTIFLDAYPKKPVLFEEDVSTVHYSDYYTRYEPPGDWMDPIPIKFLTIKNTSFKFCVISENEDILIKSVNLLRDALIEHGIGAKTSLGYGLFELKE